MYFDNVQAYVVFTIISLLFPQHFTKKTKKRERKMIYFSMLNTKNESTAKIPDKQL